jgi:hypothetical protein
LNGSFFSGASMPPILNPKICCLLHLLSQLAGHRRLRCAPSSESKPAREEEEVGKRIRFCTNLGKKKR